MNTVKVGDVVDVHFNRSKSLFSVRVVDMPSSEGDLWWFSDEVGDTYVVNQFDVIYR